MARDQTPVEQASERIACTYTDTDTEAVDGSPSGGAPVVYSANSRVVRESKTVGTISNLITISPSGLGLESPIRVYAQNKDTTNSMVIRWDATNQTVSVLPGDVVKVIVDNTDENIVVASLASTALVDVFVMGG